MVPLGDEKWSIRWYGAVRGHELARVDVDTTDGCDLPHGSKVALAGVDVMHRRTREQGETYE